VTQPIRFLQRLAVVSETEAISSGLPALAQMRRRLGEDGPIAVQAVMTKVLQDLVSFFNVGKTMNDRQCAETVRLILAEYYYLNLADFKVCFDRLKAGRYGRSYDRIDGQIILMALDEYTRGRLEAAEILSQEQHRQTKQEDAEEWYYLRITGMNGETKYILDLGDDSYTEAERHEATAFTYRDAYELKRCFAPEMNPLMELTTHPDEALLDWMRRYAPALLRPTQRSGYIERRRRLIALKAEIDLHHLSDQEISERVSEILG